MQKDKKGEQMRQTTSLDIANSIMLFELERLHKYKNTMTDSEISSDLESIKRTYLAKNGWESIFKSEVKKQQLGRYLRGLSSEEKTDLHVCEKETVFYQKEQDEYEEDLMEFDI